MSLSSLLSGYPVHVPPGERCHARVIKYLGALLHGRSLNPKLLTGLGPDYTPKRWQCAQEDCLTGDGSHAHPCICYSG